MGVVKAYMMECEEAQARLEHMEVPDLIGLGRDEAIAAMTEWFHTYYNDPSQEMRSIDPEFKDLYRGYYDAHSELSHAFSDDVSEDWIDTAANQITADGTMEWAPSVHHIDQIAWAEQEREAEEYWAEEKAEREWRRKHAVSIAFREALHEVKAFCTNELTDAAPGFKSRMAFMQVWSILEAYLSSRLLEEVEKSSEVLTRVYVSIDALRDHKFNGAALVQDPEKPLKQAVAHLKHLSFHDISSVQKIYTKVFSFKGALDEFAFLDSKKQTRHDCVHRNGRTTDGKEVSVSPSDILEMIDHSETLSRKIESFLSEHKATEH